MIAMPHADVYLHVGEPQTSKVREQLELCRDTTDRAARRKREKGSRVDRACRRVYPWRPGLRICSDAEVRDHHFIVDLSAFANRISGRNSARIQPSSRRRVWHRWLGHPEEITPRIQNRGCAITGTRVCRR